MRVAISRTRDSIQNSTTKNLKSLDDSRPFDAIEIKIANQVAKQWQSEQNLSDAFVDIENRILKQKSC